MSVILADKIARNLVQSGLLYGQHTLKICHRLSIAPKQNNLRPIHEALACALCQQNALPEQLMDSRPCRNLQAGQVDDRLFCAERGGRSAREAQEGRQAAHSGGQRSWE